MHIQEYYAKAMKNGRADGNGKLSPTTVLHHHRLLSRALQTAVKWQLPARNICDAVDPPRAKRYKARVYDEGLWQNSWRFPMGRRKNYHGR
ncbi:hypothetical protein [Desulfolucanica intricata]|uniref:hypothetical protein n=1 Tax=Desulfolucanica intricata TaxID=1285191 RepID=UPI00135207B5|nr:hypothetical protein [Desulfolucanica intricata]